MSEFAAVQVGLAGGSVAGVVSDGRIEECEGDGGLAEDAGGFEDFHDALLSGGMRKGTETLSAGEVDVRAVDGGAALGDPEGNAGLGGSVCESFGWRVFEDSLDDVNEGGDVATTLAVEGFGGDSVGDVVAFEGTAHGNDVDARKATADDGEEFEAGHAGHVEVGKDKSGALAADFFEGGEAVFGLGDGVACGGEEGGEELADDGLVFYDEEVSLLGGGGRRGGGWLDGVGHAFTVGSSVAWTRGGRLRMEKFAGAVNYGYGRWVREVFG